MDNKPIYVTVPSLCPIDEYVSILKSAWDSRILTHNGPIVQELEKKVSNYLNVKNTIAVTNGTIALQLAIRALKLKGEIITTPFSWIATASAIQWEGCTPVFVDIDPETFNIDPQKIEDAITHRTTAIMPVHVFSNPCDIEAIESIAKKYKLKVIYDAAHAFTVDYKGKSIMEYGDISCTSWHATKIFNTGEGGACFTKEPEIEKKLKRLRFFGHDEKKEITDGGLNGKMTEIHAAMGLANLPYLKGVINKRKEIAGIYKSYLSNSDLISFQKTNPEENNFSYFAIVLKDETIMMKIIENLNKANVFPRRYFYPSLNTIKAVSQYTPLPNSEEIANKVICLPSHNDLKLSEVHQIAEKILGTL